MNKIYIFSLLILIFSILLLVQCTDDTMPDTNLISPEIEITSPEDGSGFHDETITISGTASDDRGLAAVLLYIDEGDSITLEGTTEWSYSFNGGDLTEGEHTITVKARDIHTNSATDSIKIIIDFVAPTDPVVTIDGGNEWINAGENQSGVVLSISGSDAGETYNVQVTGCSLAEDATGTLDENGEASLTLQSCTDGQTATVIVYISDSAENHSSEITATAGIDLTSPSGYSVSFTTTDITPINESSVEIAITNAAGTDLYTFDVDSDGNGGGPLYSKNFSALYSSGTIIDVSNINSGILSISNFTLTDVAGNIGSAENGTNTATKQPPCYPGCPTTTWISIPGGSFSMGGETGDELPLHTVTVSDFKMMATEVLFSDYNSCSSAGECAASTQVSDTTNFNVANKPVVGISWNSAWDYCQWIGANLPTEAQWEYAASWGTGATHGKFKWALDESTFTPSNYCYNLSYPCEVESYGANYLGLYGMSGNVLEFCLDWYQFNWYSQDGASETDPICENDASGQIVARGGVYGSSGESYIRTWDRYGTSGTYNNLTGVRCVWVP